MRQIVAILGLLLFVASAPGQGIEWATSLDAALEEAKAKDKPILIAFNMDKEVANEKIAKRHYKNEQIVAKSKDYVCVLASKFLHAKEAEQTCPKFGHVSCKDHIACEMAARVKYLKTKTVNSPQHLVIRSNGVLYRRKVWYLSEQELGNFMDECLQALYPAKFAKEGEAKAAAAAPTSEEEAEPTTAGELQAAILGSSDPYQISHWARKLVKSEDDVARQLAADILADKEQGVRRHGVALGYGFKGNKDGVKVLAPYLKDKDTELRNHVAVALEDIADKSAIKPLKKRLASEKEEQVRKNLVRALATSANGDSGSAAVIIKLTRDKSTIVQRNALLSLAWFPKNKKVEKELIKQVFLTGGGGGRRGGGGGGRGIENKRAGALALGVIKSKEAKKRAEKMIEQMSKGGGRGGRGAERIIGMCERLIETIDDKSITIDDPGVQGQIREMGQDKIFRDGDRE